LFISQNMAIPTPAIVAEIILRANTAVIRTAPPRKESDRDTLNDAKKSVLVVLLTLAFAAVFFLYLLRPENPVLDPAVINIALFPLLTLVAGYYGIDQKKPMFIIPLLIVSTLFLLMVLITVFATLTVLIHHGKLHGRVRALVTHVQPLLFLSSAFTIIICYFTQLNWNPKSTSWRE
ncbi:hypothetical protein PMAYCL1PPCAC_04223, partial [Pristionchus mayeri]